MPKATQKPLYRLRDPEWTDHKDRSVWENRIGRYIISAGPGSVFTPVYYNFADYESLEPVQRPLYNGVRLIAGATLSQAKKIVWKHYERQMLNDLVLTDSTLQGNDLDGLLNPYTMPQKRLQSGNSPPVQENSHAVATDVPMRRMRRDIQSA